MSLFDSMFSIVKEGMKARSSKLSDLSDTGEKLENNGNNNIIPKNKKKKVLIELFFVIIIVIFCTRQIGYYLTAQKTGSGYGNIQGELILSTSCKENCTLLNKFQITFERYLDGPGTDCGSGKTCFYYSVNVNSDGTFVKSIPAGYYVLSIQNLEECSSIYCPSLPISKEFWLITNQNFPININLGDFLKN